jgi:lipopolysaccharide export system permease protein
MRILDKYIIKELSGPFIFGIASFSSIFIGTDVLFKMARFITEQGADVFTVAKLFMYSLPNIVVLTFPMSMLLASLLAFGRLSGNSEIVAMKTGGISFYRLTAPVVVVAFFVSIFAMFFNELVVPAANAAYTRTVQEEVNKSQLSKTQDHIMIPDIKNGQMERITYARQFNGEINTMQGVDIQEFEKGRLSRIINAEAATWNGKNWDLTNGIIHGVSENGIIEHTLRFQKQIVSIEKSPKEISRAQKKPKEMSIKELKMHIKVREREFVSTNALQVELHQRIAVPLASLIFTLIGAPLGLQPHRASSSIGLGLSIVIIFVYYSIMTVCNALGQSGAVPPVLGAWLPNLIMIAFGAWLIRRAAK